MSFEPLRIPFVNRQGLRQGSDLRPLAPLILTKRASVQTVGLLDTGADISVLPFSIGREAGLVWEEQSIPLRLGGYLASVERIAFLTAEIGPFPPVRLAFAWTATDEVRLLLGRQNFFAEFDVCFFRARSEFEIRPSIKPVPSGKAP